MRIERLHLLAFGLFTDREIALDGPGVQVIYGPNGAGKSTSMRALEGLLFGIPARTTDAWRHDMAELRVGARLLAPGGSTLDVVRRKGNKNTLRAADDDALVAEATLTTLLGGADRDLYRTMFSLSQEALRAGGEALLADQGDLGAALFGAGTGNAGARELLRRLEKEADELFLATGKKPKLNDALRRHRDASKATGQAGITSNAWVALDRQVRDAQAARDRTAGEATDVRRRLARAERVLRAFGPVKERAALLADLEDLGDARLLAVDAEQQRLDAQHDQATARRDRERAATARDAAIGELDGLTLDPAVLDHEDRIEALREDVGRYRKNRLDRTRLGAERAVATDEALGAMAAVGPHASLDDRGASVVVPAAEASGIKSLASEHAALQAAVTSADRSLAEEQRSLEALRAELESVPDAEDTSILRHAARSARAAGDLDGLVRRDAESLERLVATLRADAERLPHVGNDLDAVVGLPVPLGTTIDEFAAERQTFDATRDTLDRDADTTAAELRKTEDDLRRLDLAGDVPTEDDLRRARDIRDERWADIRTAWLTDVPAGPDDAARAEAFACDRAQTDRTADRLRAESQRVAEKAHLLVQRDRLTADTDRLETERGTLAAARAAHDERWAALWAPCGIAPEPPRAMAAWAATHRELVRATDGLAEKRSELDASRELRDEHRGLVGRALAGDGGNDTATPDGEAAPATQSVTGAGWSGAATRDGESASVTRSGTGTSTTSGRTLASLLDEAEARCEDADELRATRKGLEARIRERAHVVDTCTSTVAEARDELAAWRDAWATSVGLLDLGPEAPTTQALAVLDAIDAFRVRCAELAKLDRRIEGLERDIAAFAAEVELLRVALEGQEEGDPTLIVDDLAARLKRARVAADAARTAVDQRDSATEQLAEADAAHEGAERRLAALRAAAGVSTDDELPRAEERSARVRDLRGMLQECERRIVELGEDELDALIDAVQDADRDALSAEVEALTEQERTLADEGSRLDQELGTARGELRRVNGGDEAAAQAEVAQQALAEVGEHAERYVHVRLAAQLLRRAIESYRERTAGPVLRRADELFPELTNGAFTGVASDLGDDDEPVLLAVRGSDRIHVEHLSDGERDALYLALRVATLEHYFETSDPMPLILDDLMLNPDDDRSKAAFRVLGRLSEVTQVLLFTHHRHLVELAEGALGEGGVRVLDLAG